METMQNYNLGDVVTGVVQSVKPYGAFLDIGGTMGLLHISQITHERLTTVEQVLQVRRAGLDIHTQTHTRVCLAVTGGSRHSSQLPSMAAVGGPAWRLLAGVSEGIAVAQLLLLGRWLAGISSDRGTPAAAE